MRVVQLATTYDTACGVGNFARGLAEALAPAGVRVTNVADFRDAPGEGDVLLVHHEWGLFPSDDDFRLGCRSIAYPVVIFAHSPGAARFADVADGFMTMCEGVIEDTGRPLLVFPHPAWVPGTLENLAELRGRLRLPVGSYILGTSGLLRRDHQYPEILERLLPQAAAHDWLVVLATSRWQGSTDFVTHLAYLARRYPGRLLYGTEFLSPYALHRRLQACDLLWCWSRTRSWPYGSGSASDQYASGTRMVVPDSIQYWHVLGLPNVVRAPSDIDSFVGALVAEAATGVRSRHDGSLVSWERYAVRVATFLTSLSTVRRNAGGR